MIRYAEACAGISAASVAWESLGWKGAWFSETKKFPSRVLAYHYPNVPNLGDLLQIENNEEFIHTDFDLLAGGTPYQDFSLAGLRRGVAGKRGNLALEFCRILRIKRPRWFVWENVPGVLSVDKGQSFGAILEGFRDCGYSFAWRVLDAQYFGVPQQRQRVFVVGYLGEWRPPAAVLFDGTGSLPPADPVTSGVKGVVKLLNGTVVGPVCWNLVPSNSSKDFIDSKTEIAKTLYTYNGIGLICPTVVEQQGKLRRMTPLEWERLMGFPDGYTMIDQKAKDTPRYHALGNSIAVPILRWIGERIDRIDKLFTNQ